MSLISKSEPCQAESETWTRTNNDRETENDNQTIKGQFVHFKVYYKRSSGQANQKLHLYFLMYNGNCNKVIISLLFHSQDCRYPCEQFSSLSPLPTCTTSNVNKCYYLINYPRFGWVTINSTEHVFANMTGWADERNFRHCPLSHSHPAKLALNPTSRTTSLPASRWQKIAQQFWPTMHKTQQLARHIPSQQSGPG